MKKRIGIIALVVTAILGLNLVLPSFVAQPPEQKTLLVSAKSDNPVENAWWSVAGFIKKFVPNVAFANTTPDYVTDGTADDVQIQAANDALVADPGYGTIHLAAGIYNADDIDLTEKISMQGDGKNATYIIAEAGGTRVLDLRDWRRGFIRDLSVDANNIATTGMDFGWSSSTPLSAYVQGVRVTGATADGVIVTNVEDLVFIATDFEVCGSDSVFRGSANGQVTFISSRFVRGTAAAGDGVNYFHMSSSTGFNIVKFIDVIMESDTGNEPSGNLIRLEQTGGNAYVYLDDMWLVNSGTVGGLYNVDANPVDFIQISGGFWRNKDGSSSKEVIIGTFPALSIEGGFFDHNKATEDIIYAGANSKHIHIDGAVFNDQYNINGFDTKSINIYREDLDHPSVSGNTSVGTGAEQTVPHGLNFTPSIDQIGVFSDNFTGVAAQTSSPDSTNIYVTATADSAWHWSTVR